MIRFHCSNCAQLCEIAPILAALPLLCKGCGQRLVVPAESELLPPPPPPVPKLPPITLHSPPISPPGAADDETGRFAAPTRPSTKQPLEDPDSDPEDDDPFLLAEPDATPDIDFDLPGKTAAHESDAHRARMSGGGYSGTLAGTTQPTPPTIPPPVARPERARPIAKAVAAPAPVRPARPVTAPAVRKILPIVIDVAVALVLVVAGAFVGEIAAGKSTQEVWGDAGSSVTFPPTDLLMWLAPPVVFVLVYALLASRGRSLGGWLKRRQEA